MENSKKAVWYFGLWLMCFYIYGIGSDFYVSYQQAIHQTDPTEFLSSYQLLTLGITLVVTLPSLMMVHRYSKKYGSKTLYRIVFIVFIGMIVWAGLMILCTLMALFMPETFSELTQSTVRPFP